MMNLPLTDDNMKSFIFIYFVIKCSLEIPSLNENLISDKILLRG